MLPHYQKVILKMCIRDSMKSAYVGIKEKAEQGYYADENSATEYAADRRCV